jgi:hypothetical protein
MTEKLITSSTVQDAEVVPLLGNRRMIMCTAQGKDGEEIAVKYFRIHMERLETIKKSGNSAL